MTMTEASSGRLAIKVFIAQNKLLEISQRPPRARLFTLRLALTKALYKLFCILPVRRRRKRAITRARVRLLTRRSTRETVVASARVRRALCPTKLRSSLLTRIQFRAHVDAR